MATRLIKILDGIVANYSCQKIHKMLAIMIISVLQSRKRPEFLLHCINVVVEGKGRIVAYLHASGHGRVKEFESELISLIRCMNFFPDLQEVEVAAIEERCKLILLERDDSLEFFLLDRFDAAPKIPVCPLSSNDFSGVLSWLAGISSSYCDERFVLRPMREIPREEFLTGVSEYYQGKKFSLQQCEGDSLDSVFLERDGQFVVVSYSNINNDLHVVVQNIPCS
ncbi:hypothetical protein HGA64_04670 [Candidatus Falkowbacteria bacterium]|nr:hypothetical protein [Candidatus Falkowbacteria bacterium]